MFENTRPQLQAILSEIKEAGLYKDERVITSQQAADITVSGGQHVVNFCANNYLGLANDPALIESAKEGVEKYGFGLSSVRFICGTQDVHKDLEKRIAEYLIQLVFRDSHASPSPSRSR